MPTMGDNEAPLRPTIRRSASFSRKNLKPTASEVIKRLASNDAHLITCDLSNSAGLQMKSRELMPQLGAALTNGEHQLH